MKKNAGLFMRLYKICIGVSFLVVLPMVWGVGPYARLAHAAIQFEDATNITGVANTTISYGSSWADFNGDGRPDLWVSNHWFGASLYRNNNDGTFAEVATPIMLRILDRHGAAWADFDNDGDQDLLVLTGADLGTSEVANEFYINHNGLLTESAAELGLNCPGARGRMPLWFDWNKDGDLDVLLVNIRRDDRRQPTALYTQHADQFTIEVIPSLFPISNVLLLEFAQLSLSNTCVLGLPVVVIQRRDGYPARIYEFGANGFQNSQSDFGFPNVDGDTSDVALADFNGDLVTDFFIGRRGKGGSLACKLFLQTSTGVEDATVTAGLDHVLGYVNSVVAADFDNDMDVDLYLVQSTPGSNQLYENLGDGKFQVVSQAGGAQGSMFGRGHDVTTADFDMDGFIDLFVTNGFGKTEGPNQLFRNHGNANRWLEIDLEGTVSNRDGVGAQLIASIGGVDQLREQNGGVHRHCQNHSRIHFGCGSHMIVDKLVIDWPSGIRQELNNLSTNQIIRVVEPYSPPVPSDVIQAEDYDLGGQHVAYYDTTPGNKGGVYRNGDVDIWQCGANKYYTGANVTGEWLNYTIDVPYNGIYRLDIQLATPNENRRLRVAFDGVDKTGSLILPNTGGWTTWKTLSTDVELSAGRQVMRLMINYGGFNIDQIKLAHIGDTTTVIAPTIIPDGGTFIDSVQVTLTTATTSATIYYTTDGSDPSTAGTRMIYSSPFTLTEDTTVRAYAVKAGMCDSDEVIADFIRTETSEMTIQAEDYDLGGQHVAYYDTTPGNKGGLYRNDDVDIWRYGPNSYYTGANATGEWVNYTIDVPYNGNYSIEIRAATTKDNRRVHVEFDGEDKTGSLTAPNTGSWITWQTLSTDVTLSKGQQMMRLVIDYGGLNIDQISMEYIDN